ncbi:MAG: thiosulfate sulfurtransferase [Leptospiraceae bacterium]|nr:thiosulfate sulfurtransferase [Leptospiraceae bacterium]MCB1302858.1 thiosulfate sulfurtransferase [Leptospiraceae bacterium]
MSWTFLTPEIPDGSLILDCRSDAQYRESTIKGALGASFAKKPFGSGPQSMAKLSGYIEDIRNRMKDHSGILVFDEGQGMYACRLAWLLQSSGIKDFLILSRKFSELDASEIGAGKETLEPPPAEKPIALQGICSISHVQINLTKVQLVDVRTPEEHEGKLPRMISPEAGSVCGKIPGSMNFDWRRLYDKKGNLRPRPEVLTGIRSMGLIPERPTILYDFNGARSSTMALVLTRCGYKHVSVYLGSWMEWRKSALPKQNYKVWNP